MRTWYIKKYSGSGWQDPPLEDGARGAPGWAVDVVAEAVDAAILARRAERRGSEGGADARHRRPHHVHLRQVLSYFRGCQAVPKCSQWQRRELQLLANSEIASGAQKG